MQCFRSRSVRIRFILASRIRIRFMKRIRIQVAKKSAKIMANSHKNQPKSQEYHVFFFLILNFSLTDINIYLINNKTNQFLNQYIFDRKKVFETLVFSRVGSRAGMKRIRNTAKHQRFIISLLLLTCSLK